MPVNDASLLNRIRASRVLPGMPDDVRNLLEMSNLPGTDLGDLARHISQNSLLTDRLLRFANTDPFGKRGGVPTVRSALVLLGIEKTKSVILGLALSRAAAGICPHAFGGARFRRRALLAATAAWMISNRLQLGCKASAFLSALAMDLGMFALDAAAREPYTNLLLKLASHGDLCAGESAALGATHVEASVILAKQWNLSEEAQLAIKHHHDTAGSARSPGGQLAQVLAIASRCADAFVDATPLWAVADTRRLMSERFGMADARCNRMMREIGDRANALCPLFDLTPETRLTFDRVARRAKDQLQQVARETPNQSKASEQRSVPRIKRDTDVFILPCNGTIVGGSMRAHLRDVSARGIGLRHSQPMPTGSRFIFRLHKPGGLWTTLLYQVVRSRNAWGGFDIGAKLVRVLKDESAETAPKTPSRSAAANPQAA